MATRTERDTFGVIAVPADRLWAAQTQRSLEYFRISSERMPKHACGCTRLSQARLRTRQSRFRFVARCESGDNHAGG